MDKKTEIILIICPFMPSDINFQRVWISKVIFVKKCHKKAGPVESFLSCFSLTHFNMPACVRDSILMEKSIKVWNSEQKSHTRGQK